MLPCGEYLSRGGLALRSRSTTQTGSHASGARAVGGERGTLVAPRGRYTTAQERGAVDPDPVESKRVAAVIGQGSRERLDEVGLSRSTSDRRNWPAFQTVGEQLFTDGCPDCSLQARLGRR
jgi:hypothetical protein